MNKKAELKQLVKYIIWIAFFIIVLIAGTVLVKYLTK